MRLTPGRRRRRRPPRQWQVTKGARPRPAPGGRPARAPRWRWLGRAGIVLGLLALAVELSDPVNALVTAHDGCRVWHVIDGDTVRIMCPGKGLRSARLIGLDTPELKARCPQEWLGAVAARYRLRLMLLGAPHITAVPQGSDRYGRALIRLRLDGQDAARRMIALGLARPYAGGRRQGWCGLPFGLP